MTSEETDTTEALIQAVESLLEAASRTIFHDCGTCDPLDNEDDINEIDDNCPVDGGSCPLTIGHIRRVRAALEAAKNAR